jgi:predicted  nucleic acid-binding Zn-ribbon protein
VDINFDNLIKLQELDEEIKKLSLFLDNVPSQLSEIDEKIEAGFQAVKNAKEKLSHNQKKRRDLEGEVQDHKVKIEKYRKQLSGVKTNIEYTSLLKEIAGVEKTIGQLEEQIISEMLEADDIENEIKTTENKANSSKDELLKEKDVYLQEKEAKERDKTELQAERDQLIPSIPADQMSLYQSIFRKKFGIALSPVTDDFCSLCQIRIRPQVINELMARNSIILCENCGRILYWKPKK